MTEGEFEVLDELYFVQSYAELQESTGFQEEELKEVLAALLNKGWASCLSGPAGEVVAVTPGLPEMLHQYYYLATKAGLLAHNSR